MKILVTGGAGFVGSHLCKKLVKQGHTVICLDNLITGAKRNIECLMKNKNFRFIEHDVVKPIKLKGLNQIYHLASIASPPKFTQYPLEITKTAVIGTTNMLELAKANNATILFSSTSEVYGNPLVNPQKESYLGNVNCVGLRGCYDEGKRCAESLCMDYHRVHNVDVRIIRIFNTYGPSMDPKDGRVVTNFINQALKNENLTIQGNGEQTRSFQYVDDLIKGIMKMMNNKRGFLGPVNLGNPGEFTINEFADLVLELIPESESKKIFIKMPQDDPLQRRPNINLAKKELNWEPKIKLVDGLKPTIKYFRNLLLEEEKLVNRKTRQNLKPLFGFSTR